PREDYTPPREVVRRRARPHNNFVSLGLGPRETFRRHAECCGPSIRRTSHHETSDDLEHRTSTHHRRMRQSVNARDDDDNATVIDWSTGRYDVTWAAG